MTKLYAVLLAVLLLPTCGWAQTVLKGRVSGSDEPNGLPGAAIQVANTTRGTNSQLDGSFSINLEPDDSVLVVSYVGYVTQRVNIVGKASVDVVLALDVKTSEEVVVVGYGTQRKSDVTGSVGSLRGEDLVKVPSNNPVQALQGRATGVNVTSINGEPGSSPVVRIRGVGTTSSAGNNPLYVVDGVFMDDISSINAQDIESMELLKDASSAAIFGIRGANGVILITTKRGKSGKATFSLSTEYGVQNVAKKIDLLSGRQFAQLYEEIFPGTYNNLDRLPNTDWQKEVFRTNVPIQNHQFSASGGSDAGTYYFGLGYFKQEGIYPNSSYERISIRANNTMNLTKWLSLGNNLTISPTNVRKSPDVTSTVYRANPTLTPYQSPDSASIYTAIPTYGNPLADLNYNSNNYTKGLKGVGNLYLEAKLPFGLKYRINFGFDVNYNSGGNYVPQYFVSAAQSTPYSRFTTTRTWSSNTLLDNLLYYNRSIGKHSIDAFVGVSTYRNFATILSVRGQQLLSSDPAAWYLNTGVVPANSAQETGNLRTAQSYFGRVNYTFAGKYLLTGTYRIDQSSLFSASNRSAGFPSLGLGWVVSNEDFLKDVKEVSNLKLRASWGKLGNQAVDSASQNTRFNLINAGSPAVFGVGSNYFQGATVGATSNPNIRWEITTQIDVGVEMGFLNNRLTFDGDYYHRETSNILAALATPGYYGNGANVTVLYNAANVVNSGLEGALNWRDKIGEVGYRVGALITTIHNEVKSLGSTGQGGSFISSGSLDGSFVSRTQVGQPIGSFYGYQVIGVFKDQADYDSYPHLGGTAPGDLKFKDLNGDGKIDANDRTFMGSPIPTYIFGFNGGLSYKGFDIQADFQGQGGNKIYNGKEVVRPGVANYETRWLDRWQPNNPSNSVPRASINGTNFLPSNFYLQSGNFVRLRTLTVSYTVPQAFSTRYGIQRLNIYLRGTNLVTWSKFTGYSPEVGSQSDLSAGIDNGSYPISKVYAIGANITF